MKPWLYILLAFLGGVSFGIPASFVKVAYNNGFNTADVVGAQFFFGALLLWIIILISRKMERLSLMTIVKFLVSGIPMALTTLFYYQSLNYLPASIGIILLFQFSWMGIISEWIIDKKRPTRLKIISAIILFVGSLLAVNVVESSLDSLPIQGILWGLLGAVSFTAFLFVSGKVGTDVHPLSKSTFMATGAFTVILFIYPPMFLVNGSMTSDFFVWGLIFGMFAVVLPPILFSLSLPHMGSGLGAILTSSELPSSIVMSIIVLQENVSFIQWTGIIIILLGIMLPNISLVYLNKENN